MKKKNIFVIVMCLGLMCVGCQKSEQAKVTVTEQASVESEEPIVLDNIQEDFTSAPVEQKDVLCLMTSLEGTSLVVKNMETNETLHTYKPERESFFGEQFMAKTNDGYIAVSYTDQMQLLSVYRFDQSLQLLEEISLKDILPEEVTGSCMGTMFTNDGKKMILNLGVKLYQYNFDDGSKGVLVEERDDGLFFMDIKLVGDDKVAYIGSSAEEEEGDSCVGYCDINTGNVVKCGIKKYNAMKFSVSGDYICVNDTINPDEHKSSGKVVLLNINETEIKTVDVDAYGSTMACVSVDGKYIYAMSDFSDAKQYFLMKYRVDTGEQESKEEVKFDTEIKIFGISCDETATQVVLTYFDGTNINGKMIPC